MRSLRLLVLTLAVSACAAPRAARVVSPSRVEPVATAASTGVAVAPSAPATPPPSRVRALELAAHVKRLVGVKSLAKISRRVPDDCSGLIRWAYLQEDVDLARHADWRAGNAVATFFQLAEDAGAIHQDAPQPGDLVFFRETYDRNRDGKRNDGLTHLGVVDSVNEDGSVTFVHRANSGVKRSVMTLARAGEHRDAQGRVINDYVRAAGRGYTGKLTGELFVAFASSERMLAHVEPLEREGVVAASGPTVREDSRVPAKRRDVAGEPEHLTVPEVAAAETQTATLTGSPEPSATHTPVAKRTVAKKPEAKRNRGKARRTTTGTPKKAVASPAVPGSEGGEVSQPPAADARGVTEVMLAEERDAATVTREEKIAEPSQGTGTEGQRDSDTADSRGPSPALQEAFRRVETQ